MLKPMASVHKSLTLLHLTALLCCIASADVKVTDNTEDGEVKITEGESNDDDDLDTQETHWMIDPFQMKLNELQQIKYKVLSPFMTLKAPSQFYGGGYPVYSSGGGSSFSSGHASFSGPSYSWSKPVKTIAPSYSQNVWYNKGSSGIKYQPGSLTYAPDCDYTTTPRPLPVFVPAKPTYSSGTPLNNYYSSVTPTQTYGNPSFGLITKSSLSSYSPVAPSQSPVSVSVATSNPVIVKSSPQYSIFGYQPPNSFSSWSGSTETLPSSPVFKPSWFGSSGYYPSSSQSQVPVSSSSSGVSGYFPTSGSLPQYPAISPPSIFGVSSQYPSSPVQPQAPQSSSSSGYFPSFAGAPQIPSVLAPPSWSSASGSVLPSQQVPQSPSIPSPPYWSSFSGSLPSTPSPDVSGVQQYNVPSTTAAPQISDQGVSITSEEVSITPPPPVGVKSNIVTSFQGPNVALPQDQGAYNPASAYAVSFYPNVFYISNEQHIEKPSTETPDEGRSSLLSSSVAPTSQEISTGSTSTETPSEAFKAQTTPTTIKSPVQTTFYSSNTVDQTKVPISYSPQQPVFPITRGGLYSSPVVQSYYPIPIASVIGTASIGISQPQLVQTAPLTRTSSINSYPVPLGYNYQPPPIAFQSGLQTFPSTKYSPPC